ncbi:MAG: hypothetical protein RMX68_019705 [Aulosira sp. ZfuVER01]|nr:hypothetical protein [Aulosira sp. ZfuVER01]MDZ7996393.1 hypothetical protein [Aulosira sp. DedVER01a]MDZ8054082.1 hypothetical protein [Aulosira sp. ZfuCHP01]
MNNKPMMKAIAHHPTDQNCDRTTIIYLVKTRAFFNKTTTLVSSLSKGRRIAQFLAELLS